MQGLADPMPAVFLTTRRRVWSLAAVLVVAAVTTTGCVGVGGGGDVLTLVNEARAANGLPPLEPCGKLDGAAKVHATDMWVNDFNSHTGSDGSTVGVRASRQGYDWTTVGENIAWGYADAADAFNGWMSSPGHRANILHPAFVHHGWAHVGDRWVEVFGTGHC